MLRTTMASISLPLQPRALRLSAVCCVPVSWSSNPDALLPRSMSELLLVQQRSVNCILPVPVCCGRIQNLLHQGSDSTYDDLPIWFRNFHQIRTPPRLEQRYIDRRTGFVRSCHIHRES